MEIITHFDSWKSYVEKLEQCQECDKLHITLSEFCFGKNVKHFLLRVLLALFQLCYITLQAVKMSK